MIGAKNKGAALWRRKTAGRSGARASAPAVRFAPVHARWIVAPLMCLVAGCGSSDGDDGASTPSEVALTDLCAVLAEADCRRLEACGVFATPIDRMACERRQRDRWCDPTRSALQTALDLGQISYGPSQAVACRDAVGRRGCDIGFDSSILNIDECRAMIAGQSEVGQACEVSIACQDGLFCGFVDTCPGTCAAFAQNNEPCEFPAVCAPGLYCALPAMRCRAQAALGAACELSLFGNSCQSGSFCDSSQPGQAVCAPVRGRGAGCTSPFQCVEAAQCINNRCSAGLEGDGCVVPADCALSLECVDGRCVAAIGVNQDCGSSRPCSEGLTCTSTQGQMLCRPQLPRGAPCAPDDACYLGRCVDGACVERLTAGQVCTTAEACLSGDCDGVCRARPACF